MLADLEYYKLVFINAKDGSKTEYALELPTDEPISSVLKDLFEEFAEQGYELAIPMLPGMPMQEQVELHWVPSGGQKPRTRLDMDKTLADYGIPRNEQLELQSPDLIAG